LVLPKLMLYSTYNICFGQNRCCIMLYNIGFGRTNVVYDFFCCYLLLLYHISFGENWYCIVNFNIGFYNWCLKRLLLTTIISTSVQNRCWKYKITNVKSALPSSVAKHKICYLNSKDRVLSSNFHLRRKSEGSKRQKYAQDNAYTFVSLKTQRILLKNHNLQHSFLFSIR